jgi:hypothetical protein
LAFCLVIWNKRPKNQLIRAEAEAAEDKGPPEQTPAGTKARRNKRPPEQRPAGTKARRSIESRPPKFPSGLAGKTALAVPVCCVSAQNLKK